MNSFGKIIKIHIYGESHGEEVGVLLDGTPAGITIDSEELAAFLARRKPGSTGTTTRVELDQPIFKSGIFRNKTTGSPILISFPNKNMKSKDYDSIRTIPRPNHSDLVASKKYFNNNDYRGGGHFSGRLTVGLVAAGFIAKQVIKEINVTCSINSIGGKADYKNILNLAIANGDSLGAELLCKISNIPVGLGSPFFDSVESLISHAMFSIPGVKGILFENELSPSTAKGSEFNDSIIARDGTTKTNNSCGVVGGISNGNEIIFKLQLKPTPSISMLQKSINLETNQIEEFHIEGRHDACFALRVPPVVEALTYHVIADLYLQRLMEIKEFELR